MDFDFNEDQRLLKNSLERLLADTYDFEARKNVIASAEGWSRDLWKHFAEMGLLALPFDQDDGGLGAGAVETMLVMEALGSALCLEPYLATVVLAGGLLRLGGSLDQRRKLVPAIADGTLLMAFAHAETDSRFDLHDVATTAHGRRGTWVLNGEKRYVGHGGEANQLIVSARTGGGQRDRHGIGLFIVDRNHPGVSIDRHIWQDRQSAARVRLVNVEVQDDAAIGDPDVGLPLVEKVVDQAVAALCAEAVGLMDRALAKTIEYLKIRQQFGVTIGSFQALQHRAVDMLMKLEEARSMAIYATMMCSDPDPRERARAVSMAKLKIGEAGKFVTEQAIQLHGGIGMTDEHSIGHYYRRMCVIEQLFGTRAHHVGRLAQLA